MREEIRPQLELARLAEAQHGVVSHSQLRRLGFSGTSVERARTVGRIHLIHRGVYAVGHAGITPHGRGLAAVLACGNGAVLSHRSAAWLWGLLSTAPRMPEVTAPNRGHRRRSIQIHHSQILDDVDCASVDGIPTTAVPRTLLDVASKGGRRVLGNAIDRAERLGFLDLAEVDDLLARSGTHRGKEPLRTAIEIYRDPGFTRSKAELLFIALVRKARLPRPATNIFVCGHEIDAYWEAERFAVEVDGWDTHRTRAAFEADPLRQEDLKLAGIDSIRITARRLEREPDLVAKRLRRLLEQRRRQLNLPNQD